jgi:hypothetical protein
MIKHDCAQCNAILGGFTRAPVTIQGRLTARLTGMDQRPLVSAIPRRIFSERIFANPPTLIASLL